MQRRDLIVQNHIRTIKRGRQERLKPQEHTENFRHQLLFTKKDLKRLEQLNMLLVENKEN